METIALSQGSIRTFETMHIIIPLRRPRFWIWAYVLFALGMCVFFFPPVQQLLKIPRAFSPYPTLQWLLFLNWVWQGLLFGWMEFFKRREEIIVTPEDIRLRVPSQCSWWRRYQLSSIRHLEVSMLFARGSYGGDMAVPMLVFEHGDKTILFGHNLSAGDARQIAALIRQRFGQYMKPDMVPDGALA